MNFEVRYLCEVREFFLKIEPQARKKLIYNINRAKQVKDASIFKKLKNTEIWEFRANVRGIQYRLFSFWDKDKKALVVCTHGIVKKTQGILKKEIDKAEQLRKEYLGL